MESIALRKRFTDTAVADVLRAVDGRALVGSAALALCVIDYLAYLRQTEVENGANYRSLVADYLVPIDSRYRPAEIYAWRCSLVHTYAEARAMSAAGLDGFLMRHRDPAFHLTDTSRALTINVDTFVADVIWSTHKFFNAMQGDAEVERHAESLIVVIGGMHIVAGYDAAQSYTSMHPALRELDSAAPELERLRADVTAIYPSHSTEAPTSTSASGQSGLF